MLVVNVSSICFILLVSVHLKLKNCAGQRKKTAV